MHKEIKTNLLELSKALQSLHRDLLMLEANAFEIAEGKRLNPYELLRASLSDPKFAWLRLISTLIVHIDTVVDETPTLSGQEAALIAQQVLSLVEKPEAKAENPTTVEFWQKYTGYLAHNPDVIMKHSHVKEILARLPIAN
jgi:hypothetical protein